MKDKVADSLFRLHAVRVDYNELRDENPFMVVAKNRKHDQNNSAVSSPVKKDEAYLQNADQHKA